MCAKLAAGPATKNGMTRDIYVESIGYNISLEAVSGEACLAKRLFEINPLQGTATISLISTLSLSPLLPLIIKISTDRAYSCL